MQFKIQFIFILIGLVTSVRIDILQKTTTKFNRELISNLFQKNELEGNSIEGAEGIKILEKMLSDLEKKDTKLHRKAKSDLEKCSQDLKKLNCDDEETWKDKIRQEKNQIQNQEDDNSDREKKIENLKKEITNEKKDHEEIKEKAKQVIIGNHKKIIKMIQKVIKVMVDTYSVNSTENLNGTKSFVQTAQLLELQEEIKSQPTIDHFSFMANMLIRTTIPQLIQKKYDAKKAQSFVKLMETLLKKLRVGLNDQKNNFKYPDTQLKSNIKEIENKIKTQEDKLNDTNESIKQDQKKIENLKTNIKQCENVETKQSKCQETYESATKLADADDNLMTVLKQVIKDTKALLDIADENWETTIELDSKVVDKDAEAWISKQLTKRTTHKKATLCFRGSRDTFSGSTFHSKCDNKGASITIVKTSTNQIFGGYLSKSWRSDDGYIKDSKAWIFQYNKKHVAKVKKSRQNYAAYSNIGSSYGPLFDNGYDLAITNNCNESKNSWTSLGHSYKCPVGDYGSKSCKEYLAGEYYFKVTNYEVYILN